MPYDINYNTDYDESLPRTPEEIQALVDEFRKSLALTIGVVTFNVTYFVNEDTKKVLIESIYLADGRTTLNLAETVLCAEIRYNVEIHELVDSYSLSTYMSVDGVEYKVNYLYTPAMFNEPDNVWIRWVTLKGQPFDFNRELNDAFEEKVRVIEIEKRKI